MLEPNEDFDNETALLDARMNKQLSSEVLDERAAALLYFVAKFSEDLDMVRLVVPYALAAADIYEDLGNKPLKLSAMWSASDALGKMEDYEEAAKSYLGVANLAEELGMTLQQGKMLHNVALCQIDLKNYKGAVEFGLKALPLVQELSLDLNQAMVHKTIGQGCFGLKDFESALEHFDKSLHFYKKAHAHAFYVQAYGRKAEALMKLERWGEAELEFKCCKAHQNTLRDPATKFAVMQIEAELEAHSGEHLIALSLLEEIDCNMRETANLEGLAINSVIRAKSMAALGEFEKAIEELERVQLLCEGENFDVDLLEVTLMVQNFSETKSQGELGVSA